MTMEESQRQGKRLDLQARGNILFNIKWDVSEDGHQVSIIVDWMHIEETHSSASNVKEVNLIFPNRSTLPLKMNQSTVTVSLSPVQSNNNGRILGLFCMRPINGSSFANERLAAWSTGTSVQTKLSDATTDNNINTSSEIEEKDEEESSST